MISSYRISITKYQMSASFLFKTLCKQKKRIIRGDEILSATVFVMYRFLTIENNFPEAEF